MCLLTHASRSGNVAAIVDMLLSADKVVDGPTVMAATGDSFVAAVAANNEHGAHACYRALDKHAQRYALARLKLTTTTSGGLMQLVRCWLRGHGMPEPRLQPPGPGRAPAPPVAAPPGDPGDPVPVSTGMSEPILLSSASNRRVAAERTHARHQLNSALLAGCTCGCAGRAAPALMKYEASGAKRVTLEVTLSSRLFNASVSLNPDFGVKFRAFLRDVSTKFGQARRAVHTVVEVVMLRELNKQGFGDLHQWNFPQCFEQIVQSLRPEYKPKSSKENRYAWLLPPVLCACVDWLVHGTPCVCVCPQVAERHGLHSCTRRLRPHILFTDGSCGGLQQNQLVHEFSRVLQV